MTLSKEDQEALAELLTDIRRSDPNPDAKDPNKELRKITKLIKHAGTVDRAITVVNAFGMVGQVLKYLLVGIVGLNVLLLTLSGQLKTFLASLFAWAGK